MSLHRTAEIIGCTAQAIDGKAGSIHDILFDDDSWKVRYLVVRSGVWLEERMVLIPPQAFLYATEGAHEVHVTLSCDQIRQSRSLEADPPFYLQRQIDAATTAPTLWMTYGSLYDPVIPLYGPALMQAPPEGADVKREKPDYDPHLRSVREISGYQLEDADGEAGQLVGFLVDNEVWALRYVVIQTGSWFAKQQRLLTVSHISAINWERRTLTTSLHRERIAASPEYADALLLDPAFENRLLQYYLGNSPIALGALHGLPLFEIVHGSLLGTIDDLYLSPDAERCTAVHIYAGGMFRQRALAIPFDSIQLVGEDVWLVGEAEATRSVAQFEAEGHSVRAQHLIGRQVVTEGGTPIGSLGQVVIRRDGRVEGFQLQAVQVKGPLREHRFIARSALITIGDSEHPATTTLAAAEQSVSP